VPCLLDTNVFPRLRDTSDPLQAVAEHAVSQLRSRGDSPYFTAQNLVELPPVPSTEDIEAGKVDPNALAVGNRTVLALHAGMANVDDVRRLLAAGADPNFATCDQPGAPGAFNYTALMAVAEGNVTAGEGLVACCRLLLEAGADPSMRDSEGRTALDYAVATRQQFEERLRKAAPPIQQTLDAVPAALRKSVEDKWKQILATVAKTQAGFVKTCDEIIALLQEA
jgi:hypothetical protein